MSQNTSTAVMAQRIEPHDSLDDFPTPPWAGRALVEHVLAPHYDDGSLPWRADHLKPMSCWEPACNRGYLAEALRPYFKTIAATDIHDYGWRGQQSVSDFLYPYPAIKGVDWVITNPPFRLAEQFIERALKLATIGVAIIVRTSFLESVGRHERLFTKTPPTVIAQFAERVPMVKGRLTATGSTATAYCWLVWMLGETGTEFTWIPPCRKAMERDGDYDANC